MRRFLDEDKPGVVMKVVSWGFVTEIDPGIYKAALPPTWSDPKNDHLFMVVALSTAFNNGWITTGKADSYIVTDGDFFDVVYRTYEPERLMEGPGLDVVYSIEPPPDDHRKSVDINLLLNSMRADTKKELLHMGRRDKMFIAKSITETLDKL